MICCSENLINFIILLKVDTCVFNTFLPRLMTSVYNCIISYCLMKLYTEVFGFTDEMNCLKSGIS